jgi:hypothetical protein
VTGKVQRQTCPSRRWRTLTGQWESCLEHLEERPEGSAARGDRLDCDAEEVIDTTLAEVS